MMVHDILRKQANSKSSNHNLIEYFTWRNHPEVANDMISHGVGTMDWTLETAKSLQTRLHVYHSDTFKGLCSWSPVS